MRVIAGKLRGRKLVSPKGDTIRPTKDNAKESLFNILQFDIIDKSFLDLFAGSLSMSFEATSRGAKDVTSVDNSKESKRCYLENSKKIPNNIKFMNQDVTTYLQYNKKKFDFIFLDPPYEMDINQLTNVFEKLITICNPDTIVILEFSSRKDLEFDLFKQDKLKKYGKSSFYFYQLNKRS